MHGGPSCERVADARRGRARCAGRGRHRRLELGNREGLRLAAAAGAVGGRVRVLRLVRRQPGTRARGVDVTLTDDQVVAHHGDALDVLAGMDAASVDAVVTDPPYSP